MSLTLDGELQMRSEFDGELQIFGSLGSGDKTYVYEQSRPSDIWIVNHKLHKYPSVSIVDTAKTKIVGDVVYMDEDTVRINFNAPVSGYAYFN